ncbi:MAG: hypothetical protein ABEJ65_09945 [bacterium]
MITAWISVLSLIVAVFSAFLSWIAMSKSNDIDERMLELEKQRESNRRDEKQKAKVEALITGENRSRKQFLKISNKGESKAENIRVFIDDEQVNESSLTLENEKLPDNFEINSGSDYKIQVVSSKSTSNNFDLKILWDDEFERNRKYETNLSIS